MQEHEKHIHKQALALSACARIKGWETTDELAALFFTAQGLEFAKRWKFPALADLRPFRGQSAARVGFYIDSPISARNEEKIAIAGPGSTAVLEYDDGSKLHTVVVMHGAKAKIIASRYAVVSVVNIGGDIETIEQDRAIIFNS